ncbi:MAG: radical SAM protein [Caldilineaceae bacterium]|nr:radical SAM protein [Caldilineaceae bacterium]
MSETHSPRPASGALTQTGGFLTGFTHTLQPYIGCRFGCDYCYVQESTVHRFHGGGLTWGEYVHPRTGIAEKLAVELARFEKRGTLDQVAIFMSSTTDPYQGAERRWGLTRACLEVLGERPPGLLVIQTRSPLVERDFDLIRTLGDRAWLSFTLETDLDEVRRTVTPHCPSVAQRLETLKVALAAGINVQVAVSPCLPFSSVETFGALLLEHGDRVVVDTYASGDGGGGKRTAKTAIPAAYAAQNWGDWRAEDQAQALYEWLRMQIGERAGWSQAGFTALARTVTEGTPCS